MPTPAGSSSRSRTPSGDRCVQGGCPAALWEMGHSHHCREPWLPFLESRDESSSHLQERGVGAGHLRAWPRVCMRHVVEARGQPCCHRGACLSPPADPGAWVPWGVPRGRAAPGAGTFPGRGKKGASCLAPGTPGQGGSSRRGRHSPLQRQPRVSRAATCRGPRPGTPTCTAPSSSPC